MITNARHMITRLPTDPYHMATNNPPLQGSLPWYQDDYTSKKGNAW
jgi:hypothetical protein